MFLRSFLPLPGQVRYIKYLKEEFSHIKDASIDSVLASSWQSLVTLLTWDSPHPSRTSPKEWVHNCDSTWELVRIMSDTEHSMGGGGLHPSQGSQGRAGRPCEMLLAGLHSRRSPAERMSTRAPCRRLWGSSRDAFWSCFPQLL